MDQEATFGRIEFDGWVFLRKRTLLNLSSHCLFATDFNLFRGPFSDRLCRFDHSSGCSRLSQIPDREQINLIINHSKCITSPVSRARSTQMEWDMSILYNTKGGMFYTTMLCMDLFPSRWSNGGMRSVIVESWARSSGLLLSTSFLIPIPVVIQ